MFKRFFSLLLALIVFSSCNSKTDNAQAKQKIIFCLDWTPNTNHTGIYVAKDLGYYDNEGFDIEIIQPPEDGALSLVASEKADFGISFEEEVLIATNSKQPLPVLAVASVLEHNTSGMLSLKEKNITRFKDLEGKKIASWQVPVYDEIIRACILADGGDPSKVTFVPNNASDAIHGIQQDFDAAWVYEGWDKAIADMQGIETNFISFRSVDNVFDYYTPVIITNIKNKETNSEMVQKFLNATSKGYEYSKLNPEKSAEILSKYAPEMDKKIIQASQKVLSNQYYDNTWGIIDENRWNNFYNWMKEKNLFNQD